ncbi:MAG: lytic transglycosylase domain-containing protein, partial [Myxococcota bacterium]
MTSRRSSGALPRLAPGSPRRRGRPLARRVAWAPFAGALLLAAAPARAQPEEDADLFDPGEEVGHGGLEAGGGEESPSLAALRAAEGELFERRPPSPAAVDAPSLGFPEGLRARPREAAEAGAASVDSPAPPTAESLGLSLDDLRPTDLPVRWQAQVLRYLDYFKSDRRGRRLMRGWIQRSARYGAMIQRELRAAGQPEDLRCVAMAESGFDPTVRSRRGAAGMWQFVEGTGAEYGLTRDRWVDARLDPVASTRAAARFLGDLHQRFGSWELALAAYNMGYGALLRAIRKYNTNDYWTLAALEAGLPFETRIYVAKISACAVVMRNPERFGFGEL